jgi:hypothetical protein
MACLTRAELMRPLLARLSISASFESPELLQAMTPCFGCELWMLCLELQLERRRWVVAESSLLVVVNARVRRGFRARWYVVVALNWDLHLICQLSLHCRLRGP